MAISKFHFFYRMSDFDLREAIFVLFDFLDGLELNCFVVASLFLLPAAK